MQYEDRLPFNMFQLSTPTVGIADRNWCGRVSRTYPWSYGPCNAPNPGSGAGMGFPPSRPPMSPGPWRQPRRSDVDEPFRRFLQIWLEVMSECSAAPWPGGSGFGVGEATWEPCPAMQWTLHGGWVKEVGRVPKVDAFPNMIKTTSTRLQQWGSIFFSSRHKVASCCGLNHQIRQMKKSCQPATARPMLSD